MAEGSIETSFNQTPLYQGLNSEVIIPTPSKIPLNEGLSLEIKGSHDATDNPRQILERFAIGLGVAKIVAESGLTRDAWANTRLEKGQAVNVYGRVPGEENSWRKPVDTNREINQQIDTINPTYNQQKLSTLMQRYLPKWELGGRFKRC